MALIQVRILTVCGWSCIRVLTPRAEFNEIESGDCLINHTDNFPQSKLRLIISVMVLILVVTAMNMTRLPGTAARPKSLYQEALFFFFLFLSFSLRLQWTDQAMKMIHHFYHFMMCLQENWAWVIGQRSDNITVLSSIWAYCSGMLCSPIWQLQIFYIIYIGFYMHLTYGNCCGLPDQR